jgi:hypothetical protein
MAIDASPKYSPECYDDLDPEDYFANDQVSVTHPLLDVKEGDMVTHSVGLTIFIFIDYYLFDCTACCKGGSSST